MDIFKNLLLQNPSAGGGSAATWGSITGTLSSQTDLQNALNAKANLSGATFTGGIVSTLGTITTSTPMLSGTQTWSGGGAFTGLLLNVTDSSSTAGSLLLDLQTASATRFKVDKGGQITLGGGQSYPTINFNDNNNTIVANATTKWMYFCSNGNPAVFVFRKGISSGDFATLQSNGGLQINAPDALTSDSPLFGGTQTWNNAAVSFNALKLNVTDTASAAGSLLADLQIGGSSRFKVGKDSSTTWAGQSLTGSAATSLLDLSTTWNTTGNPTAIKLNVTNTASGSSSLLMDLQVGGTSKTFIDKNGTVWAQEFRGFGANNVSVNNVYVSEIYGYSGTNYTMRTGTGSAVVKWGNNGLYMQSGYGFAVAYSTVASLPAASSWTGYMYGVTDATQGPTSGGGSAPTGGGSYRRIVYSDGTNWLLVGPTSSYSGTLSDGIGDVRSIPQNAQTAAYVLAATDNGKHISITTGGVTVNSGIFSAGQVVTIYNNSSSNQTITQGASVTMYQGGTTNTGNRTLASYGVATVLCVASNTFVITGSGLS